MLSKIISGAIAVAYVIGIYLAADGATAFRIGAFLTLPLACIWFSDAMGGYTGGAGRGSITSTSPGNFVAFFGWVLLLMPVIVAAFMVFTGNE